MLLIPPIHHRRIGQNDLQRLIPTDRASGKFGQEYQFHWDLISASPKIPYRELESRVAASAAMHVKYAATLMACTRKYVCAEPTQMEPLEDLLGELEYLASRRMTRSAGSQRMPHARQIARNSKRAASR
ncbi:hypothetical protein KM043_016975 [Ampulex compressa]|nr:hypothetical protein KM043_016975 [Ampulex compressa]